MKTLSKLSAIAAIVVLRIIGCKKNLLYDPLYTNPDLDISIGFDAKFVKEWYYGVFKKSATWKNSQLRGKQLPDWKNGIFHRVGNMEIVEYPLGKARTIVSVPSGKNLSSQEAKRIADACLVRIAFIKTPDNKVTVRELDYIPDEWYLKAHNYDITGMFSRNGNNRFSGRIITRNWNGEVLSYSRISEGKLIAKGVKVQQPSKGSNTRNTLTCEIYEICEYERECEWTIIGDQWENVCGEWTPTGNCWTEEYCNNEDPCEYMTEEECVCQVYGNCNGGEENNCDPSAVSQEEEEFNDYVLMETQSEVTIDHSSTNYGPDPITGSYTWDVAKAQIASWVVRANTEYTFYHDAIYNANTNTMEHTFNLTYFHTGSGYFVGSNTFIQSTYSQPNPTENQVFNNNSWNTYGKSHVVGTITHQLAIPLNCPICPKILRTEDEVNNSTKFYPM